MVQKLSQFYRSLTFRRRKFILQSSPIQIENAKERREIDLNSNKGNANEWENLKRILAMMVVKRKIGINLLLLLES